MKKLLLALFLVPSLLLGAGDFSFDVTSDGADNRVFVTHVANYDVASAFSLVLRYDGGGVAANQGVVSKEDSNVDRNFTMIAVGGSGQLAFSSSSGGVAFAGFIAQGGTKSIASNPTGASYAGTCDVSGGEAKIAEDGVVANTDSSVLAPDTQSVPILLGCVQLSGGDCLALNDSRGTMSDIRLYSRTLTTSETQHLSLRNSRPNRVSSGGLVLDMPLIGVEGAALGASVPDRSHLANHGDGSGGTDPTYSASYTRGHR